MDSITCYQEWRQYNKGILKDLSKKSILMLYSGGKDSSFALDLLSRAARDFNFDFKTHAGAFPNHRYTNQEKKRLNSYWNEKGVDIIWHNFLETDEHLKNAKNPCTPCRDIRKGMLKNIIGQRKDIDQLVVIISFSLWDLVSYSLEHILGDIYTDLQGGVNHLMSQRFKETAQRFYPYIRMKEGYSIFRPILRYNGNYILDQIKKKGIPVLAAPCAYGNNRPKRVLEAYYNKTGLSFDYENVFHFAEKALGLPDPSQYSSIVKEKYLEELF